MNKLGTVLPPDDPALVALNQFLHDNPGPHWPADINFYQGKLLEGKRWVATVDTESGPVMTDGQIGKTKIPLKLVKDYFPRIDETTRFAPFAAADTTAPVANRLRRDRLPQGPVLRFPTARTRPRRPRTLRLAA
jgi:hypothetical protein